MRIPSISIPKYGLCWNKNQVVLSPKPLGFGGWKINGYRKKKNNQTQIARKLNMVTFLGEYILSLVIRNMWASCICVCWFWGSSTKAGWEPNSCRAPSLWALCIYCNVLLLFSLGQAPQDTQWPAGPLPLPAGSLHHWNSQGGWDLWEDFAADSGARAARFDCGYECHG